MIPFARKFSHIQDEICLKDMALMCSVAQVRQLAVSTHSKQQIAFWTIVFIGSIALFLYQSIVLYSTFKEHRIETDIKVIY